MAWEAVSPLVIPEISNVFNRAQNEVPGRGSLQGVSDFTSQGMNSPLLQTILQPALRNLMQGEAQGRTALADQFRAAGGLRGSQYGKAIPQLEGQFQQQRGNLISDLTSRTLSPLIQGLLTQQGQQFMPADALSRLLAAVRPDISFDRGGGGGGGGGGLAPTQGPTSMANNPFFSPTAGAGGAGGAGGTSVPGGQYRFPGFGGQPQGGGGGDPYSGAYENTAAQAASIAAYNELLNNIPGLSTGGGRMSGQPINYGGQGGFGGGGPGDMMFGMTPEEWGSPWGSLSPELNQQNQPSMLFDPTGMGVGGGDVMQPQYQDPGQYAYPSAWDWGNMPIETGEW